MSKLVKTKPICQWLGGSHSYELSTPKSDIDDRLIFLHNDPSFILGLNRYDQEVTINKNEDIQKTELRRFFNNLRRGHSQSLEALWMDESKFKFIDDEFKLVRNNREYFMDTRTIFLMMSGYIRSQIGKVTDDLKMSEEVQRKDNIEKYGYHPKPAIHVVRLAYSAHTYFSTGRYEVVPTKELKETLLSWKTEPEKHSKEEIIDTTNKFYKLFIYSYENRVVESKFDENKANEILLQLYKAYL